MAKPAPTAPHDAAHRVRTLLDQVGDTNADTIAQLLTDHGFIRLTTRITAHPDTNVWVAVDPCGGYRVTFRTPGVGNGTGQIDLAADTPHDVVAQVATAWHNQLATATPDTGEGQPAGPPFTADGIRFDNAQGRDAYLALKALPDERLLYLARSDGHRLKARGDATYLAVAGENTNPTWVTGTAANIALDRDLIDETEHERLTR